MEQLDEQLIQGGVVADWYYTDAAWKSIRPKPKSISIIYGSGAAFADSEAPLIYKYT